ncbi:NADPH-dependent oxidoreductase [Pigmentiphaga aceris]|uniref:NADPH-dependent oxidoreductase n=1 Tax=Pigmentiphaga aceris TaxID=1940612 RepID=A0A5C0B1W4_9BURK|nr:NADPH-dependent oxidoreductase [Pigmentiphaga aceris]QEI08582.1 NADPH-dependent oxidoreductase [Pigmentiphaga aceris]
MSSSPDTTRAFYSHPSDAHASNSLFSDSDSLFPDARAHLQRRYRELPDQLPADWNDTLDTLLSHRSVRSYLNQPLPKGALETAIAAAQSAPSSSNLQAWSVIAVTDTDRKARINAVSGSQRQISEAPLLLVWLADLSRLRGIADSRSHTADGLDYLETFLLAVIDAALAAQNAVTAFNSLGLGSCYIGAIRNNPTTVAAELGLPPEVFPVFGLTVGVPDPARATDVKPRLPQSSVLHREQYESSVRPDDLARYDSTLRDFQIEQSLPAIDWTQQLSQRIGTAAALKGRDRLGEVLKELGFKLK